LQDIGNLSEIQDYNIQQLLLISPKHLPLFFLGPFAPRFSGDLALKKKFKKTSPVKLKFYRKPSFPGGLIKDSLNSGT